MGEANKYARRTLGNYEVVCQLARGGTAEILLAFQRGAAGFLKFVVLKQVPCAFSAGQAEWPEFIEMLINEAKITASFSHPNLAQVYNLDTSEDGFFLVMELVIGATLGEAAVKSKESGQPLPIGFTLAVVRDTALALAHAHEFRAPTGEVHQVIHRDIKPSNIMISDEGTTKLLDFGIAKGMAGSRPTTVGTVKGTPRYMSPEQLGSGQALDPRSDIFSLGIVLHECLTGKKLFGGANFFEQIKATLHQPIPPPSRVNPRVPPALDAVVLRALERDRGLRFSSALEFARAIEAASNEPLWRADQRAALMRSSFGERCQRVRELLREAGARPQDAVVPLSDPTLDLIPITPSVDVSYSTAPHPAPGESGLNDAMPVTVSARRAARTSVIRPVLYALAAVALAIALISSAAALHGPGGKAPAPPSPLAAVERGPAVVTPDLDVSVSPSTITRTPEPSPPATEPPAPTPPIADPPEPAPRRVAPSFGWLTIDSRPWARILLDGADLGLTPIAHLRVRSGLHLVEAIRSDGTRQKLRLKVLPAKEEAVLIKW